MNFLVYATADNKLFVPCGVIEGSAFTSLANNLEQCKAPWDNGKLAYRVVSPATRQHPSGLAVILQKDFILMIV